MHSSSLLIQLEGEALFPPKMPAFFWDNLKNSWTKLLGLAVLLGYVISPKLQTGSCSFSWIASAPSSWVAPSWSASESVLRWRLVVQRTWQQQTKTRLERWKEVVWGGPFFFSWQVLGARCFFGFWTSRELFPLQKKSGPRLWYCWWKKSCTSWYGESTSIYRVVSI